MTDVSLIKSLEEFYIQWCNGFLAPLVIEYPFGKQMICYPGDAGAVLWTANIDDTNWTYEEVINIIEKNSRRYFGEPSFSISDSWNCDRKNLTKMLEKKNYKKIPPMVWWRNDLNNIPNVEMRYELVEPKNAEDYALTYQKLFRSSEVLKQRIAYQIERPMSACKDLFLGAYDGEKLIGVVAYAIKGDTAYYHSVAIDSEYRKQGLAAGMISHALNEIKDANVKMAFTITNSTNIASAKLQEATGFEKLFEKTLWIKA